ncbi:MAG: PHP-associated domain-containing protein [Acidobacteriota bacterium]
MHSCLSPCADLQMVPPEIVERMVEKGITIIGICDHNSCENAASFISAGNKRDIVVFPGIEVTTREEVHILGLFGALNDAMKLQELIYGNLSGVNDEEAFGVQAVVDEQGNPIAINERLLIGATNLPVENVVDAIHSFRGVCIASHIDRESFSIIGQLGFIPEDLRLDAIELSPRVKREEYSKWQMAYSGVPILCSSDAHFLDDVGKCSTAFWLVEATFDEFKKALRGEGESRIIDWLA